MTVTTTGAVGIGTSTPSVRLDVIGSIEYTGTITDVSDMRLKENFSPIKNSLSKLQKIKGYTYNMNDDETKKIEYGVTAQELQKIFPEMVTVVDAEKGYLGVSYIQLIPVLLEAIKEQQVIIEQQKEENDKQTAELENQNYKIEKQNFEIKSLKSDFETRIKQIELALNTIQQ